MSATAVEERRVKNRETSQLARMREKERERALLAEYMRLKIENAALQECATQLTALLMRSSSAPTAPEPRPRRRHRPRTQSTPSPPPEPSLIFEQSVDGIVIGSNDEIITFIVPDTVMS